MELFIMKLNINGNHIMLIWNFLELMLECLLFWRWDLSVSVNYSMSFTKVDFNKFRELQIKTTYQLNFLDRISIN